LEVENRKEGVWLVKDEERGNETERRKEKGRYEGNRRGRRERKRRRLKKGK